MMFPDPFEDELLYSVIARLADRMGLDTLNAISRYIFEHQAIVPSAVGLPKIHLLVPRLLPESPHTAYSLMAHCSLVPYYTAFSRHHSTASITERLMANHPSALQGLYGPIASPLGLQFCEQCVAEDVAQGRELFWVRSHQLPGVSVCHRHLCSLREGSTSASDRKTTYLSLARVISKAYPTRKLVVQAPQDIIARVAVISHDLLAADLSSRDIDAVSRFFGLLADRGFRHQDRPEAISRARLNERLLECFGPDIIKELGVEHSPYTGIAGIGSAGASTQWIYDSITQKGRVSSPLPYILVLIAIGSRVAELTAERMAVSSADIAVSSTDTESEVIDVCGNTLCHAYDSSLMENTRMRSNRSTFHAACSKCGFAFRWTKGKTNGERRWISQFGKLWDDALADECCSGSMPTSKMIQHFGIARIALMKRALQLGIWHPRWNISDRAKLMGAESPKRRGRVAITLDEARAAWLRVMAGSPNAGRSMLRRQEARAYHLLMRSDREWLDQTNPKIRSTGSKPRPLSPDDAALAERIARAASDISAREPLTRITRRLIFRALGRSNVHLPESIYPESLEALRAVAAAGSERSRLGGV